MTLLYLASKELKANKNKIVDKSSNKADKTLKNLSKF